MRHIRNVILLLSIIILTPYTILRDWDAWVTREVEKDLSKRPL